MPSSLIDTIAPSDLGLPPKFESFRLAQRQALDWLNTSSSNINAACLPTGSGKTALAVAYAQMSGARHAVYLVATKALQEQVLNDFRSMGMTDIRGRANYKCPNWGDCAAGYDEECSIRNTTGCAYTVALEKARNSKLTVTNYAYWLHARMHNKQALELDDEPIDLLICDEAHALENQLSSFASVTIYKSELGKFNTIPSGIMTAATQTTTTATEDTAKWREDTAKYLSDEWRAWASAESDKLKDSKDEDDIEFRDRLRRIAKMGANWVWQFDSHGHVTFEPIRLTNFITTLFSSVERVLLMSASLNEFTLKLLLPDDLDYDYRAWSQVFNPAGAPVYHIPCRKLSWRSTDEDYKAIVAQSDAIIDSRLDRKGIIHTVSYARARRALQYSRYVDRYIWNENTAKLASCLGKFRAANNGSILCTPSVSAGFDFPGRQCEYQIILKFPFPNETQKVVAERCQRIPGYRLWSAAQELVQMCGRARRYEEDRCETFVLDNAVRQLTSPGARQFMPLGFRIFTVAQIPKAPPRLTTTN